DIADFIDAIVFVPEPARAKRGPLSVDHPTASFLNVLPNAVVVQTAGQQPDGNGDEDREHDDDSDSHIQPTEPKAPAKEIACRSFAHHENSTLTGTGRSIVRTVGRRGRLRSIISGDKRRPSWRRRRWRRTKSAPVGLRLMTAISRTALWRFLAAFAF